MPSGHPGKMAATREKLVKVPHILCIQLEMDPVIDIDLISHAHE